MVAITVVYMMVAIDGCYLYSASFRFYILYGYAQFERCVIGIIVKEPPVPSLATAPENDLVTDLVYLVKPPAFK